MDIGTLILMMAGAISVIAVGVIFILATDKELSLDPDF